MSKSSPVDFLNTKTKYSSEETVKSRLSICNSCDMFKFKICKSCGCFMPAKVKLAHAECPLNKWGDE